jgi:hypothetical protein
MAGELRIVTLKRNMIGIIWLCEKEIGLITKGNKRECNKCSFMIRCLVVHVLTVLY